MKIDMNDNYKHHIVQGDAKPSINSEFAPESLSNLFFWQRGVKMNSSTHFPQKPFVNQAIHLETKTASPQNWCLSKSGP